MDDKMIIELFFSRCETALDEISYKYSNEVVFTFISDGNVTKTVCCILTGPDSFIYNDSEYVKTDAT